MENKSDGKESNLQGPRISDFEAHWSSRFLDASFEDWLTYLRQHNDKVITSALLTTNSWPLDYFTPPGVPETVFKWCQQLQQSNSVLFRTVEIYDRFALAFSGKAFSKTTTKKPTTYVCDTSRWKEVYTEFKHQCLLHLISCLQIASKLENGYKVVTVQEAAALLRQAHRPCDPSTITNSEVFVLVTLGYDVNYPPISDFVDIFICQLIVALKKKPVMDKSRELLSVVDEIHEASKLFVRAIYFDQQVIIRQIVAGLYGANEQEGTSDYDLHIRKVQCDKVLLATGAVLAATFLIQQSSAAYLMKELHLRTGAHPSKMVVVSTVLATYIEPDRR